MRTPIAHALAFPERIESGVAPLDLFALASFHFERPDLRRFPCLDLAYQALRSGGSSPAVLNAANEVAVQSFLDGMLAFTRIAEVNAEVLATVPQIRLESLVDVLQADAEGRATAREVIARQLHK